MPSFRSGLSTAQQREFDRLGPAEQKAFKREYNKGDKIRGAQLRPSAFKQTEGFYNSASGSSE